MADCSNIKRVIIRREVSPAGLAQALGLLALAKQDLEALNHALAIGMVTPAVFKYMLDQIAEKHETIAKLMGFDSADDMTYYQEHFMNL